MIDKKILDLQQPSTRACLERPVEKDEEWLNRIIPKEAQCVKEDGSVDLNVRVMTAEESDFYNKEYGASKIYGRNSVRGDWFETVRTLYLGKYDVTTPRVMPSDEKIKQAMDSFLEARPWTQKIKDKFKELMSGVKKELSYAEKIAEGMRRCNEE